MAANTKRLCADVPAALAIRRGGGDRRRHGRHGQVAAAIAGVQPNKAAGGQADLGEIAADTHSYV